MKYQFVQLNHGHVKPQVAPETCQTVEETLECQVDNDRLYQVVRHPLGWVLVWLHPLDGTFRISGAIYKTRHEARQRLRTEINFLNYLDESEDILCDGFCNMTTE